MSVESQNFYILNQSGPFAVREEPYFDSYKEAGQWVCELQQQNLLTEFRERRGDVFSLLEVSSFGEIQELSGNPARRADLSPRVYERLGRRYNMQGSPEHIEDQFDQIAQLADQIIEDTREDLLYGQRDRCEMTNEVQAASNVVDLLTMSFDKNVAPVVRFESIRKLTIINLLAKIQEREREINIGKKYKEFLDFLNDYVYSSDLRHGEVEPIRLISTHDMEGDMAVKHDFVDGKEVVLQQFFTEEEVNDLSDEDVGDDQSVTVMRRRGFTIHEDSGPAIPIYTSSRRKSRMAMAHKLIRKGFENPAVAVDDDLGMLVVLPNKRSIYRFMDKLRWAAEQVGNFSSVEELTDTIDGGEYKTKNEGSDKNLRMIKFFYDINETRVEIIAHTPETYINSVYQNDVSHDEYEIRRFFNTGVADRLFPTQIYRVDHSVAKQEAVESVRLRKREQLGSMS